MRALLHESDEPFNDIIEWIEREAEREAEVLRKRITDPATFNYRVTVANGAIMKLKDIVTDLKSMRDDFEKTDPSDRCQAEART